MLGNRQTRNIFESGNEAHVPMRNTLGQSTGQYFQKASSLNSGGNFFNKGGSGSQKKINRGSFASSSGRMGLSTNNFNRTSGNGLSGGLNIDAFGN